MAYPRGRESVPNVPPDGGDPRAVRLHFDFLSVSREGLSVHFSSCSIRESQPSDVPIFTLTKLGGPYRGGWAREANPRQVSTFRSQKTRLAISAPCGWRRRAVNE